MERQELEEKVLNCVAVTYKKELSEISLDTRFREDLKGASILLVGVVSLIENELDVLVSLPEASGAATIRDLVDLVEKNQ